MTTTNWLLQRTDTGEYLASYDVDWRPVAPPPGAPDWMRGLASWTTVPGEAMHFASLEAAMACRHQVPIDAPVRDDGQPNMPLTAHTLSFTKIETVSA